MMLFYVGIVGLLLAALAAVLLPMIRQRSHWGFLLAAGLFIPTASLLAYAHWGAFSQVLSFQEAQNASQKMSELRTQLKTPAAVIAKLKQRLKQSPNSARGWYLLGRLYMLEQHTPDAIAALKHSVQLKPNNIQYLLALAAAEYAAHHQMTANILVLLKRAEKIAPNNLALLDLKAAIAFNAKDYHRALSLWRAVLAQLPPQSPQAKQIETQILRAQAKRGGQA
jgi:cytochrome c-type biogenesis protein CcmH/NrfG